jgi:hypothetical protein
MAGRRELLTVHKRLICGVIKQCWRPLIQRAGFWIWVEISDARLGADAEHLVGWDDVAWQITQHYCVKDEVNTSFAPSTVDLPGGQVGLCS